MVSAPPPGVTAHRGPHKRLRLYYNYSNIGWELLYEYTSDLLCLGYCLPHFPLAIPELVSANTPLIIPAWEVALAQHPDRAFARYICQGLREGFRIGFRHGAPLRSASANMQSARLHPEVEPVITIHNNIVKCSLTKLNVVNGVGLTCMLDRQ